MAEESFVFYWTTYRVLSDLDDSTRLRMYDAICWYWTYGLMPNLTWLEKSLFISIQRWIDDAKDRYKKSAENWRKWWAPKWNDNARKWWDKVTQQRQNDVVLYSNSSQEPHCNDVQTNIKNNSTQVVLNRNSSQELQSKDNDTILNEVAESCLWTDKSYQNNLNDNINDNVNVNVNVKDNVKDKEKEKEKVNDTIKENIKEREKESDNDTIKENIKNKEKENETDSVSDKVSEGSLLNGWKIFSSSQERKEEYKDEVSDGWCITSASKESTGSLEEREEREKESSAKEREKNVFDDVDLIYSYVSEDNNVLKNSDIDKIKDAHSLLVFYWKWYTKFDIIKLMLTAKDDAFYCQHVNSIHDLSKKRWNDSYVDLVSNLYNTKKYKSGYWEELDKFINSFVEDNIIEKIKRSIWFLETEHKRVHRLSITNTCRSAFKINLDNEKRIEVS